MNEVIIQALEKGLSNARIDQPKRDLHDVAGTWQDDADFDRALAEQDSIDKDIWR